MTYGPDQHKNTSWTMERYDEVEKRTGQTPKGNQDEYCLRLFGRGEADEPLVPLLEMWVTAEWIERGPDELRAFLNGAQEAIVPTARMRVLVIAETHWHFQRFRQLHETEHPDIDFRFCPPSQPANLRGHPSSTLAVFVGVMDAHRQMPFYQSLLVDYTDLSEHEFSEKLKQR